VTIAEVLVVTGGTEEGLNVRGKGYERKQL
jgi:hypothetical protein